MAMLAASGFGIFRLAQLEPDNAVWQIWDYETFQQLKPHFTHPPWASITGWGGVSFWDLIQPSFMFMVGVAMPFSYARRGAMGSSNTRRLCHAVFRAIILTLMGVFLASQNSDSTNWIFTNVLAQIGLGYVFAYLLLGRSTSVQLGALVMILMGYWGFFVWNPPPAEYDYAAVDASLEDGQVFEGEFAAWSKNANAGHFFDVWFLNVLRNPADALPATDESDDEVVAVNSGAAAERDLMHRWLFSSPDRHTHNRGGYVTLNFIPSIATILLGILCGQLLMGRASTGNKLGTLILAGAICFGLGILAHDTVCPIVKRIWTPSWVLFSGGYVIWMLAAFYLVFDILPLRKLAFPLVVVGMNSIVMYMLGQLLRPWVGQQIVRTHFAGLLSEFFGEGCLEANGIGAMLVPTTTFAVFWLVAFWMYRNRYFVRV
jgi:heparan-alpha-glucosaminide N-acetyltransferase